MGQSYFVRLNINLIAKSFQQTSGDTGKIPVLIVQLLQNLRHHKIVLHLSCAH